MKHVLLIAVFSVAACSTCCAPNAQGQLELIKAEYAKDMHAQPIYCNTHISCNAVRTAGYNASASLLIAEDAQSASAIARARADVQAFTEALGNE